MRDLLDSYMQHRKIDPHDIKNPSHPDNIRDENNKKKEIFKYLTENTSTYKTFLAGSGVTVKFWSERKPCDYNDKDPAGGQCKDFIEKICPIGSLYGYTTLVPKGSTAEQIKLLVQTASEYLKRAYRAYVDDVEDKINIIMQDLLDNNISYSIDDLTQTLQDTDFFSTQLSGATADDDVNHHN